MIKNKIKNIIKYSTSIFAAVFILSTCSNQPLLSELVNTRMTLVLKGTYESNGNVTTQPSLLPYKYSTVGGAAGSNSDSSSFKIYLDLADIRLASGNGPGKDPKKYWQYFAQERVVMCPDTSSISGRVLTYCSSTGGIEKHTSFFNGNGITLSSAVDVEAKTYNHLAVFFRKFVSYPAFTYSSAGAKTNDNTVAFDGQKIYGDNAGLNYFFSKSDDTSSTTPRLIPLENKNLSITIPDDNQPFVLEVRIFINGLLMKHLTKLDNGNYISFIGPSDWSQNNYDMSGKLGGNFTLTARVYQPNNVGSITTSAALRAVVPAGTTFSGKALPIAASSSGTITNLAPGKYDVYTTAADSASGFPTAGSKCATVTVNAGSAVMASGC